MTGTCLIGTGQASTQANVVRFGPLCKTHCGPWKWKTSLIWVPQLYGLGPPQTPKKKKDTGAIFDLCMQEEDENPSVEATTRGWLQSPGLSTPSASPQSSPRQPLSENAGALATARNMDNMQTGTAHLLTVLPDQMAGGCMHTACPQSRLLSPSECLCIRRNLMVSRVSIREYNLGYRMLAA